MSQPAADPPEQHITRAWMQAGGKQSRTGKLFDFRDAEEESHGFPELWAARNRSREAHALRRASSGCGRHQRLGSARCGARGVPRHGRRAQG